MARYEKEIEAKQRVIAQLTQANREFETLCLNGVVGDQEGELVKLRNENVELPSQGSGGIGEGERAAAEGEGRYSRSDGEDVYKSE